MAKKAAKKETIKESAKSKKAPVAKKPEKAAVPKVAGTKAAGTKAPGGVAKPAKSPSPVSLMRAEPKQKTEKAPKIEKAPKEEKAVKAEKPAKVAKDKKASKAESGRGQSALSDSKWSEVREKFGKEKAPKYSMTAKFEVNTGLEHPKLGWGYVLSNLNDRLEVLFEDGIRILISNYNPNQKI